MVSAARIIYHTGKHQGEQTKEKQCQFLFKIIRIAQMKTSKFLNGEDN